MYRSINGPRVLSILYLIFSVFIVFRLDAIVPPLAAPDEITHLFRSASIADGHVIPTLSEAGILACKVDSSVLDLYFTLSPSMDIAGPRPADIVAKSQTVKWTGVSVFAYCPNTAQYGPALYLPQAAGLRIGRSLGFPLLESYRLSRLLSGLLAVGLGAIAIAKSGRACFLLAVVLSAPIFLFLATSASQDGLLISMAALFVASTIKAQASEARKSNWLALVCAVLMSMARPPYAILSLLLIRARNDRPVTKWLRAADGPLGPVVVVAMTFLYLTIALGQQSVTLDAQVNPSAQLSRLVNDPALILSIAKNTVTVDDFYVRMSREIVGVLGYLSIILSDCAYQVGINALELAALSCFLMMNAGSGRSIYFNAAAIIAISASLGAVYGALYLTWTPVGEPIVQGVQGRYLLPLLLAVPLAAPRLPTAQGWWKRYGGLALEIAGGISGLLAWGWMISIAPYMLCLLQKTYTGELTRLCAFGACP